MEISFFLGANSGGGFYSLYDDFPGGGVFLHIIKGGPGGGKSGFMGRLSEAAGRRGLDTELILCSGDPDSLDGLYIPALGQAWVDGTAPHVREPGIFGCDSDYVNLGRFCALPLSESDKGRIGQLNREYKELYRRAYAELSTLRRLRRAVPALQLSGSEEAMLRRQARDTILDAESAAGSGRERRRFISGYTCLGQIRLSESVYKLCKLLCLVGGSPDEAAQVLALVRDEALTLGADIISCPDPLEPEKLQAVLLPGAKLSFIAEGLVPEDRRYATLRLDAAGDRAAELRRPHSPALSLEEQSLASALERLREAKALHDELELVYRPYIDFHALDAFTADCLSHLFR